MDGENRATDSSGRRRGALTRVLGTALIVAGIPLLVLPGPGLLLIGAGLGMLGWNRVAGRPRTRPAGGAPRADDRRATEGEPGQ